MASSIPPFGRPSDAGLDGSLDGNAQDAAAPHDASGHMDRVAPAPPDAAPPPADSGTAVGRDAATLDANGSLSDPFACRQASDCEIKNVGNCCGYYPRCANISATFSPPDCSGGQVGVCGFPDITSCDCRANRCVSLQNGNPVSEPSSP